MVSLMIGAVVLLVEGDEGNAPRMLLAFPKALASCRGRSGVDVVSECRSARSGGRARCRCNGRICRVVADAVARLLARQALLVGRGAVLRLALVLVLVRARRRGRRRARRREDRLLGRRFPVDGRHGAAALGGAVAGGRRDHLGLRAVFIFIVAHLFSLLWCAFLEPKTNDT